MYLMLLLVIITIINKEWYKMKYIFTPHKGKCTQANI